MKTIVNYILIKKKEKFKKYFKAKKEGGLNNNLKFNINLNDCSEMFMGCKKIIYINFIYFNMKYVINLQ